MYIQCIFYNIAFLHCSDLSNGINNYTPAGISASRSANPTLPGSASGGGGSRGEISLRPGKTYNNMFKPNTPSMLPKSAQVPQNIYGSQVYEMT